MPETVEPSGLSAALALLPMLLKDGRICRDRLLRLAAVAGKTGRIIPFFRLESKKSLKKTTILVVFKFDKSFFSCILPGIPAEICFAFY